MDRRQIIDRVDFLNLLEQAIKGSNIALIGSKKTGKTLILKNLFEKAKTKNIAPVYLDLKKTDIIPENFSIQLVGAGAFCFLNKEYSPLKLLPWFWR